MAFRILSKSVRLLCLAGTVLFVWGSYAPARAAQVYTINNTDTEVRVSFTEAGYLIIPALYEETGHRTDIIRPYSSKTHDSIFSLYRYLIDQVAVYEYEQSSSDKLRKLVCGPTSLPADSPDKKYYFVRVTLNQSSPGGKITCDFFFR
ncbi:MAG: hypothetical protein ACNI3A_02865 [Desulfovibrio sp.]|uniref:hypothetical protein n=1 Tax=Desulfovibrio sp. 7SRBS1 TaxID=3378064 RepID=UPI003B419336